MLGGRLTLHDTGEKWRTDSNCAGSGGYNDIRGGAQVTVKDGKGEILRTTSLGEGVGVKSAGGFGIGGLVPVSSRGACP